MNSLISIKVIFCTLLINPEFSLKVQRTHYVEDGCNVGEDWKKRELPVTKWLAHLQWIHCWRTWRARLGTDYYGEYPCDR